MIGIDGSNAPIGLFRLRQPPGLVMLEGDLHCLIDRQLGHACTDNDVRRVCLTRFEMSDD